MTVDVLNPLEDPDWNERIRGIAGACFFHSAEWAATLNEAYGFRPLYLVSRDRGEVRACLPLMEARSALTGRRGVSLPFTDFCPPLCAANDDEAIAPLVSAAHAMGARLRWKYVEWRSVVEVIPGATPFRHYLTHSFGLTADSREMFGRIKSATRTAIRKAEASGLRVTVSRSEEDLRAFYRLHCMTRRDHGLPPPPYSFFRALHRHALRAELGRIVLARRAGAAVAGAVFLEFGKAALFKYGASDKRHQSLRGSNLVMWEGIRRYGEDGFDAMNLGRTSPAHEGLLRFKRAWGSEESTMAYYRFEPSTNRFVTGNDECDGLSNRVFRRLPMPLLRICGSLLYKHAA